MLPRMCTVASLSTTAVARWLLDQDNQSRNPYLATSSPFRSPVGALLRPSREVAPEENIVQLPFSGLDETGLGWILSDHDPSGLWSNLTTGSQPDKVLPRDERSFATHRWPKKPAFLESNDLAGSGHIDGATHHRRTHRWIWPLHTEYGPAVNVRLSSRQ